MTVFVWVAYGWAWVTVLTAFGARFQCAHVLPDAVAATVVFLAFRRTPVQVCLTTLMLGYLLGRQAVAPVGLHETALVVTGLFIYLAAGNLAGSGVLFFALASGGAAMLYPLLTKLVAWLFGNEIHFTGWATASLLPMGLATAVFALATHWFMARVDKRLEPAQREELSWH